MAPDGNSPNPAIVMSSRLLGIPFPRRKRVEPAGKTSNKREASDSPKDILTI